MNLTNDKEYRIACVGFFMMLFLANSFVVTNDIISSTMTIALWVMTAVFIIYGNSKIRKELLVILMVIAFCMLCTTLFNRETFRPFVLTLFAYAVAMIYVNRVSLDTFKEAFISVMYWLSIISLIGFALYRLFPVLHNINIVRYNYSNLFIYIDTTRYTRNTGMFWEPGAYQTFLNIALLFEILKNKFNAKKVIIFIITILTTYSTTGYLALLLIVCIFINKKDSNINKKGRYAIIGFLFLLIVGIYFNQELIFGSSLSNGQQTVLGKLFNFDLSNSAASSASVRYYAIIKPIALFFQSPIFGHGYEGLKKKLFDYTLGMNTCTFINWFAVYGIIYGGMMMSGMYKFSKKNIGGGYQTIFVLLLMFLVTMSQNYVNNAIFLIFVLYGYKKEHDTHQSITKFSKCCRNK